MRAVLCGYYGMGNGGDEALLATLLQMLPSPVTPIVLSGNPAETAQRYGVEAVERKSLPAVWSALRQSQFFIWGGGSLMQDATSAINPLYYGGLMQLAQLMGLKTVAWAQGIGPLRRPSSRWLARLALRGCEGISVRDRASAQLLSDWNLPCLLAPDPVWALASKPVPQLWNLPAPRVAVALRAHPQLSPERQEVIIQALVNFQKATQVCLILLPFQPIKDRGIADAIAARLTGPHAILTPTSPQQLKGVFRGIEMTIGMRFHALVMAAAEGCRCFAISYDPKVEQIVQALDLPAWTLAQPGESTLPALPSDASTLSQAWLQCYANGDPLSADQIQSRLDRALMHQDFLIEAFQ
ncbi:polysaccharide pyruvyl transferase CsaB [Romeria aff. gracilis LEGE 07310]|uniref:Polysaccharide pyruvyl transferase CsaB n=1 Tax=Vasconcelosia minhoensis LEGE 07310 TaxID=915328 RepID=A0A8J7AQC0_9CYAN|nr:polysaccharide pyruvyl transferase CsaB [Romeria gracilis]MBE9078451.1 polysaccharide pyruvyl transferase CsaB [Romeria aff. gracilis LEGE 07310]